MLYRLNYKASLEAGQVRVGASEFFLGLICNCLSYFITAWIPATCKLVLFRLWSQVDKPESLSTFIQNYFGRTEANERIRQKYDVLDLPGHELVQQPKQSMQKLCDYLDIICEEDYIEACAKLLYGEPSITRNHVVWTDEQKRWVQQEIDKYSFLRRYSFESYP